MASIKIEIVPIPFCKLQSSNYLSAHISLSLTGGTSLADFPLLKQWPQIVKSWLDENKLELFINGSPLRQTLELVDRNFPGQPSANAVPYNDIQEIWQLLMVDDRPVVDADTLNTLNNIQTVEFGHSKEFIDELSEAYSNQLKTYAGINVKNNIQSKSENWLAHINKLEGELRKQGDFYDENLHAINSEGSDNLSEFHNLLASLGDETLLLRGFMLILDLRFEMETVPSGTISLRFKGPDPTGFSFVSPEIPFDGHKFDITTSSRSPILNRYLKLPHDHVEKIDSSTDYYLNDLDPFVVGFAVKDSLTNAKQSISEKSLPPLQSHGISISATNTNDNNRNYIKSAILGNDYSLDSLLLGYRVDVQHNGIWYSLCKRDLTYYIRGNNREVTVGWKDEGVCSENVTHTKNPDNTKGIFVPDALFKWDGWSLVAPRLEEWSELEDDSEIQPEDLLPKVQTMVKVSAGSLPKLRFGEQYKFRVRVVDICGNSKHLTDVTPDEVISYEITYCRQEPLPSPSVTGVYSLEYKPEENPYGNIDICIKGESNRLMVVRSNESISGSESNPYSARYISAPRVSQKFCESHGVFDAEQGLSNSSNVRKQIAASFELEEEPTDKYNPDNPYLPFERYVRYLPDPAVQGFTIHIVESLDGIDKKRAKKEVEAYFKASSKNWPVLKKWAIVLKPGNSNSISGPHNNPVPHIVVTLKKGEKMTIELVSFIDPKYIKILGIDSKKFSQNEVREIIKSIVESNNRQIASRSKIELIHAVQQPLSSPKFISMAMGREKNPMSSSLLGSTSEEIFIEHFFPGKTANRLELFGSWVDWEDKPGNDIEKKSISKFVHRDFYLTMAHIARDSLLGWLLEVLNFGQGPIC